MSHIRYWLFSVQEASRIRTEAENTKKRAVDLKDNADLLAEDVADTDDQIVNLNVQAESDSELATEVWYFLEIITKICHCNVHGPRQAWVED